MPKLYTKLLTLSVPFPIISELEELRAMSDDNVIATIIDTNLPS
jgi:hypothetical protein